MEKNLPAKLSRQIGKYFPIPEPKKAAFAKEFQITSGGVKETVNKEFFEWHFFGKEREKELVISPDTMFINYLKYDSFEILVEDFQGAFSKLFELQNDLQVRRVGLRYMNNIEIKDEDPFAWEPYLNQNLLGVLNFYGEKQLISRAFHNLEFNFGDSNLRFQFGMHNPDYPSPIRKKQFILDYDAYYVGVIDYGEVEGILRTFHRKIQDLFEMSITENLRVIMNG